MGPSSIPAAIEGRRSSSRSAKVILLVSGFRIGIFRLIRLSNYMFQIVSLLRSVLFSI
jgi:hypothetical protein